MVPEAGDDINRSAWTLMLKRRPVLRLPDPELKTRGFGGDLQNRVTAKRAEAEGRRAARATFCGTVASSPLTGTARPESWYCKATPPALQNAHRLVFDCRRLWLILDVFYCASQGHLSGRHCFLRDRLGKRQEALLRLCFGSVPEFSKIASVKLLICFVFFLQRRTLDLTIGVRIPCLPATLS